MKVSGIELADTVNDMSFRSSTRKLSRLNVASYLPVDLCSCSIFQYAGIPHPVKSGLDRGMGLRRFLSL